MKKYLFVFIFILLCCPQPLAAGEGRFVAEQGGQTLAEYIDGLSIEDTTKLVIEIGLTNIEVPPNIARLVNLKEIFFGTDDIPGSITDYDERLKSGIEFSKIPEYNRRIVLPMELFTLPSLEELTLKGLAQYRLRLPLQADEVKTSIRILSIDYPYKETIDFWPIFQSLEELHISHSTMPELSESIYSFKNLKRLSIKNNAATIHFDKRLNGLSKLETINLDFSSATWPKDMSKMVSLKLIVTEDCGASAPELIGWRKYYFPAGIHSLPNLERLYVTTYGRLELPPRGSGLTKLEILEVYKPQSDGEMLNREYMPCQPAHSRPNNSDYLYYLIHLAEHTERSLDRVTEYSSLEDITIDVGAAEDNIKLARLIKAAYQAKKMPNLKVLSFMGQHDGSYIVPYTVFKVAGAYDDEQSGAIDIIDQEEKKKRERLLY